MLSHPECILWRHAARMFQQSLQFRLVDTIGARIRTAVNERKHTVGVTARESMAERRDSTLCDVEVRGAKHGTTRER